MRDRKVTARNPKPQSDGFGESSSESPAYKVLTSPNFLGRPKKGFFGRLREDFSDSPIGGFTFLVVVAVFVFSALKDLGYLEPADPGPPLEATILAQRDGADILFHIEGVKLTDRALVAQVASWVYSDGTAMPVAYVREENPADALPGTNGGPVRVEGEYFVSGLFRARVHSAVINDPEAQFRVCWVYDALPVYCAEIAYADIGG